MTSRRFRYTDLEQAKNFLNNLFDEELKKFKEETNADNIRIDVELEVIFFAKPPLPKPVKSIPIKTI